MNVVFAVLVLGAVVVGAFHQLAWDGTGTAPMDLLSTAVIDTSEGAVKLSLGMVGVMTFFLGLMKVAEAGGLLAVIAKLLRPLLVRLFPEVPANHPAMGAIIMNLAANVLGLGNAATPFGIQAMRALERLNPHPGTATNAMVLFLAINTSSVTLLPTGVVALRAAAGSADPAGIVPTTLFATLCSTATAIVMAKLLAPRFPAPKDVAAPVSAPQPVDGDDLPADDRARTDLPQEESGAYPLWVSMVALAGVLALVPLTIVWGKQIAPWIIPGLAALLLGYGVARRVRVYEIFVDGARDGFQVAVKIIPYLVAILVAVGLFRASGAMTLVIGPLAALTTPLGLPAEALPMALLRPLSGSGAYGILAALINDPAVGPDSYTGYLVSTIQGSTETTFYVLAVYFGAVGIRRVRHALVAALCADLAGVVGSVVICQALYG